MSKLRADEFVNSDDNGAPSFPHSATVPAPTADNHFATKLYTDTTASTAPTSITNTISNTAPSNPSEGDFWTNTSQNIISLNIWKESSSSWVNVKNSIEISTGQIVTPPSISDPNGGYIPTMLTATSAVVSDATLSSSKWYKDDVEIPGATGLQYYATDTGTYKYEEIWVDTFGTQLFPSLSAVIDARAGVIDAQPTITSSNGVYSPTTLTATAAVVSNATLVGSRWYKDGVEIPDSSGLSINILAHEQGIYKYEETWTDHFGTQLLPTLSASVQVFATIADPTVLTPANGAGINPDFDYTAESSAITNASVVEATNYTVSGTTLSASDLNGLFQSDPRLIDIPLGQTVTFNNDTGRTVYVKFRLSHNDPSNPNTRAEMYKYVDGNLTGSSYVTHNSVWPNHPSGWNYFTHSAPAGSTLGLQLYSMPGDGRGVIDGFYFDDTDEKLVNAPGSTTLTLTDTTVSRASDGSLIEGTSIDQVLTVGEVVRPLGSKSSWVVETDIDEEAKGIDYDSNGNVYVAYKRSGGSGVSKFDADGVLQWKKTFSNGASDNLYNLKVDSSDNIVVSSTTYYGSKARYGIFKINPSGEIQWSKHIDNNNGRTANEVPESGLYIDASDNIYVCGYSNLDVGGGATYQLYMVKLNSSGDLQLNRHLRTSGTNLYGKDVAVDNSGNIYISGYGSGFGDGGDTVVAKYNSSGNHQWTRAISSPAFDGVGFMTTDGTYIYVNVNNGSDPSTSLVKLNSSGNIVWQRKITASGATNLAVQAMDTDSAGNIYVSGYKGPRLGQSNGTDGFYAKWNSSGTLQWQRYITSDANQYPAFKLSVDDSGSIYICGRNYHTGYLTLMVAKIPEDGSLTGTYGSYTFGDTNYTEGAASFSSNTVYLTSENESLSSNNVPRTVSDSSDTLTTTSFGTSGTITAFSGNTITLSDVSGTWSNGMKVQGTTTDFYDSPDPISPSQLSLTSSEPAVTQGSVTTWGNAQWQVAEDSGFTTNIQSLTSALTSSGTQTGPTGFTLDYNKNYYVRTKYGSSNPAGVFSNWSVPSLFKTVAPLYADDLFSTYLYKGNGSTQTITNGIDLTSEGGLVWTKARTHGYEHNLVNTETGVNSVLQTNGSEAALTYPFVSQFNSDGYGITNVGAINHDGMDFVSWTFRKAPGFFDVVTYTGDGNSSRGIAHALGTTPGMIIIKATNVSNRGWAVYHRSVGAGNKLALNLTDGVVSASNFYDSAPTDSVFYPGNSTWTNDTNTNYVAYLFAHDDQSFGTNGDEAIIKCGSYTTNSSGVIPDVNLGFEPQWLLIKNTSTSANWYLYDSMRGMPVGSNEETLYPNLSNAAVTGANTVELTSTGFTSGPDYLASGAETFIYMAIRRPHKPPTSATEVFNIQASDYYPQYHVVPSDFAPDLMISTARDLDFTKYIESRLTDNWMDTSDSNAENTGNYFHWDAEGGRIHTPMYPYTDDPIYYQFRRAPGFFDVVSYSSVTTTTYADIPHNLGVQPELVIVKSRSGTTAWHVWSTTISQMGYLNMDHGFNAYPDNQNLYSSVFYNTDPTDTTFRVGTSSASNRQGSPAYDYIAYLFASLDGISKVGTYSGTGSNINVDCGFTAGSRFILIKRTDSTGDWYLWDAANGIISGNDPYMLLNSTAARVTNTDYIDPLNAGFTVNSGAPAALNASGGTYLFLAIA